MNKYQKELQGLKSWDEIQSCEVKSWTKGYEFIYTAGHGYLVVPKEDKNAEIAKGICEYGFTGDLAYYLEEDCEAGEFIKAVQ